MAIKNHIIFFPFYKLFPFALTLLPLEEQNGPRTYLPSGKENLLLVEISPSLIKKGLTKWMKASLY